jgi:metal-responsive CopG/Arc/MetJ family transcriptional regulator
MVKNRSPRVQFVLDDELIDALERLQQRDGMSASEAVRRALRAFLAEKKVLKKAKRSTHEH